MSLNEDDTALQVVGNRSEFGHVLRGNPHNKPSLVALYKDLKEAVKTWHMKNSERKISIDGESIDDGMEENSLRHKSLIRNHAVIAFQHAFCCTISALHSLTTDSGQAGMEAWDSKAFIMSSFRYSNTVSQSSSSTKCLGGWGIKASGHSILITAQPIIWRGSLSFIAI